MMLTHACVEPIHVQDNNDRKVVVNCVLCNDSVQTLKLTYSTELGKFYYKEVDTAQVELYEDSVLVGQFIKADDGEWKLNYSPIAQKHYELKINIPDRPAISATTTMPNVTQIAYMIGFDPDPDTDSRRNFSQYKKENPYWIFVLCNPNIDSLPEYPIPSNYFLMGDIGTNNPDEDHFNENTTMVYMSDATTLNHYSYIRINALSNTDKTVNFYVEGILANCVVFFRASSTEYDKYMKSSIQKMMVYQSFNDPTQYFDENVVYSNIVNGIGIFGAYADQQVKYYHNTPLPQTTQQ